MLYWFSATVFVHAETMKDMNMWGMSENEDCMMLSGEHGQIDADSLDCIEMCMGDYDTYFISQISLEDLRIFEKIRYIEENIFEEKSVFAFHSDIDPPWCIGNISENEFHKILVKVE